MPFTMWSRMAPMVILLASVERKREALGVGKLKAMAAMRDFLALVKGSACYFPHRKVLGLPALAAYRDAMTSVRVGMKR